MSKVREKVGMVAMDTYCVLETKLRLGLIGRGVLG